MEKLRKVNTIVAPLLWFVGVFLVMEFAFSAHWTRNLPISINGVGVLWLLITGLWILGVVDTVHFSKPWREVKLGWFIPACIVNVLGLAVFLLWAGQLASWWITSGGLFNPSV